MFVSSLSLLIRAYNRARWQAEILLSAMCKKAEPALTHDKDVITREMGLAAALRGHSEWRPGGIVLPR